MKRVIALAAAAVVAAVSVQQRMRSRAAEQALWAEATDAAPTPQS